MNNKKTDKNKKKLIFLLISLCVHLVILFLIYKTEHYSRKNIDLSAVGVSIFYHIYVLIDMLIDKVNK